MYREETSLQIHCLRHFIKGYVDSWEKRANYFCNHGNSNNDKWREESQSNKENQDERENGK